MNNPTASEVRAVRDAINMTPECGSYKVLTEAANILEAMEKAEPVAWLVEDDAALSARLAGKNHSMEEGTRFISFNELKQGDYSNVFELRIYPPDRKTQSIPIAYADEHNRYTWWNEDDETSLSIRERGFTPLFKDSVLPGWTSEPPAVSDALIAQWADDTVKEWDARGDMIQYSFNFRGLIADGIRKAIRAVRKPSGDSDGMCREEFGHRVCEPKGVRDAR